MSTLNITAAAEMGASTAEAGEADVTSVPRYD